jgi:hypothetical protein
VKIQHLAKKMIYFSLAHASFLYPCVSENPGSKRTSPGHSIVKHIFLDQSRTTRL